MNLTQKPDIVNWPASHFVFIEKIGPFQKTAQKAWQNLIKILPTLAKKNKISGFMSLYKIQPQMIYRAGVILDSKPEGLPSGIKYMRFKGGKYSRFILTGSYENLPEACGRVFAIVEETKIQVRKSFFIEHYLNDPKTTPQDQLITEIMIPTK